MLEYFKDRRNHIKLLFLLVTSTMIVKLAITTVVEGEFYRGLSENKRLKKIPVVAKRGEILDRNGQMLAGNKTAFTVQLISGELPPTEFSKVAFRIIDLLDKKGEQHIEFPIRLNGKQKYYQSDLEVSTWLANNGYEPGTTAKQVYETVRQQEQISPELDNDSAQKYLLLKGITLPISVKAKGMAFISSNEKKQFLKSYGLDENITPEAAFAEIRLKHKIPNEYSDEQAYKIMVLYYALKGKGCYKYQPIKIANQIDKKTAVLIEEMSMELPGIKVEVEPIREYPLKTQAAHAIGYMGKITSEKEKEKYITQKKYLPYEVIGKTGIEGTFEDVLRGTNGYKYVEVDAYGKQVREVEQNQIDEEPTNPKSGKSVQLTIDSELQKVTEESLNNALTAIRTGTYKSPWGDYKYGKTFPKAYTGSVVVVDVKTGEILALANQPSYDPNLFSVGISAKDWATLQPKNPRDPLAPRPLYNLAAQTAVQPGSTFKMVTGYAALESGFSPKTKLKDNGSIKTKDGTVRGCWIWNKSHGNHGYVDLTKALEVSCNYYFFDVSNGYDYAADRALNFKMGAGKLIDYAKLFGLNDASGVEIGETVAGVPDTTKKKRDLLIALKKKMKEIGGNYFDPKIIEDEDQFNVLMKKINALADRGLGRKGLARELIKLGSNPDETVTEKLADTIKFSYFNQMKWFQGDTFNLSIGQGGHTYTPLQMARYVSAIANDGTLNKLTLVKSIDGVEPKREVAANINPNGNLRYIREGMNRVATGPTGTCYRPFQGLPVKVAAKTGTAQKEGKLPPEREEEYLKHNLRRIAPRLSYSKVELEAANILAKRNEEASGLELKCKAAMDMIAQIEKKAELEPDSVKKAEILAKIEPYEKERVKYDAKFQNYLSSGLLEKGSAMREAIKVLSKGSVKDEQIDQFKADYDNFTWFVSFAPYEKPEIAVVVMIPQGGAGGNAGPIVRDIYSKYFNVPTSQGSGGIKQIDSNEAIE